MNTVKTILAVSALSLPLISYVIPAAAATANNSQAGSMGHTKSMEKPTVMDMQHMGRTHHRHRRHHM